MQEKLFILAILALSGFAFAWPAVNVSDPGADLNVSWGECKVLIINETYNRTSCGPDLLNKTVQCSFPDIGVVELTNYTCASGEVVRNTPKPSINMSLVFGQTNSTFAPQGFTASCPACNTSSTCSPCNNGPIYASVEKIVPAGTVWNVSSQCYSDLILTCQNSTAINVTTECPKPVCPDPIIQDNVTEKDCTKEVQSAQYSAQSAAKATWLTKFAVPCGSGLLNMCGACKDPTTGAVMCPEGYVQQNGEECVLNCAQGTVADTRVCKDSSGLLSCPAPLSLANGICVQDDLLDFGLIGWVFIAILLCVLLFLAYQDYKKRG